jgi:hypothetical protein
VIAEANKQVWERALVVSARRDEWHRLARSDLQVDSRQHLTLGRVIELYAFKLSLDPNRRWQHDVAFARNQL